MTRITVTFLAAVAAAAVCGCALQGTVIDRNLAEIPVKNMRLRPDSRLKILHGDALRRMPLRILQRVEVFPEDFISYEGEVYYACRVTLKSGEEIAPRSDKNKLSKTYVCVNGILTGMGRDGTVRIPMEGMSKLLVR